MFMSSVVYFENKKYISAKDAASLTSYTSDYIGQLCRNNHVDSKKIGRTWYVSEESILNYKNTPTNFDFSQNLKSHKNEESLLEKPSQTLASTSLHSAHKTLLSHSFNFFKYASVTGFSVLLLLGTFSIGKVVAD